MKNVSIIKKMSLMVLAVVMITMCASVSTAKAAEPANPYGKTVEERAQELISAAANYGLINADTIDEFKPGKPATYAFVMKTMYRAYKLQYAGCATIKAPSTNKALRWLRSLFIYSYLDDPSQSDLILRFYDGKGLGFKPSEAANYKWIETALVIVTMEHLQEEGPVYSEWRDNQILEVQTNWADYRKGEQITRIEALNLIINIMRPDIPIGCSNDPIDWDELIGPPCPPAEEPTEVGAIAVIDGITYVDGKPIECQVGPAIMIDENGITWIDGVPQIEENVTYIGQPAPAFNE